MVRLVYSAIASLDGYVADAAGRFEWCAPDEQVHADVNDRVRPLGTMLLGRRMYEVLTAWDDPAMGQSPSAAVRDFAAIWLATDKIVYSRTFGEPSTARTVVRTAFDPDEVRALKQSADRDLSVGGPYLAAQAVRAGLVDEYELYLSPVLVGGGTAVWPADIRVDLELIAERRFDNGVVGLRYRVRNQQQER